MNYENDVEGYDEDDFLEEDEDNMDGYSIIETDREYEPGFFDEPSTTKATSNLYPVPKKGQTVPKLEQESRDLKLWEEAKAGSAEAFEELIMHYHKPLGNYIQRTPELRDRWEDILQEVFLAVHKYMPNITIDGSVFNYLWACARNRCNSELQQMRRNASYISSYEDFDHEGDPLEAVTGGPAGWEDPERVYEIQQKLAGVEDAIEDYVSDSCREAFRYRVFDGLSYRQVAEIMDLPESTVKSKVVRARKALSGSSLSL